MDSFARRSHFTLYNISTLHVLWQSIQAQSQRFSYRVFCIALINYFMNATLEAAVPQVHNNLYINFYYKHTRSGSSSGGSETQTQTESTTP